MEKELISKKRKIEIIAYELERAAKAVNKISDLNIFFTLAFMEDKDLDTVHKQVIKYSK